MAINLKKGERVEIGLKNLTVGLGWDPAEGSNAFDLDATACMLGENKKLVGDEYFVFYSNMTSPDGACQLTDDDTTGENSGDGDDEQIYVRGNFKSLQKCLKILAVIRKWSVFGGYSLSSHAQQSLFSQILPDF